MDAPLLFEAVDRDRERLGQWLPWVAKMQKVEDELAFLERVVTWWEECEQFDWLIFRQATHEFCGVVSATVTSWSAGVIEIGYWLHSAAERQGYMREAVVAVQAQMFRMGFHRIEIRCAAGNERSANVPKGLGYQLDGRLRGDRIESGRRDDTLIFSCLAEEPP